MQSITAICSDHRPSNGDISKPSARVDVHHTLSPHITYGPLGADYHYRSYKRDSGREQGCEPRAYLSFGQEHCRIYTSTMVSPQSDVRERSPHHLVPTTLLCSPSNSHDVDLGQVDSLQNDRTRASQGSGKMYALKKWWQRNISLSVCGFFLFRSRRRFFADIESSQCKSRPFSK